MNVLPVEIDATTKLKEFISTMPSGTPVKPPPPRSTEQELYDGGFIPEPPKKPKVLVLSSIPPRRSTDKPGEAWEDLAVWTCATHKRYCDKWGYDYHLDVSDIWEKERSPRLNAPLGAIAPIKYFIKFLLFQHFLDPDSCGQEWDWVCWFDSDTVITNYGIPLDRFFNGWMGTDGTDGSGTPGDIVLSYDPNGLHATMIFMRRTALTLGFAWANGNAGKTYFQCDGWGDQLSMRRFLETPPYDSLVRFFSIKELCAMYPNTYPIPERARKIYEWEPGDFCLHLSALSVPKRIEIASKVIMEHKLL